MALTANRSGWMTRPGLGSAITEVRVSAYRIPTEAPEADGTLTWDHTTYVVVHVDLADGVTGLGFAVGDAAMQQFIDSVLVSHVKGKDVQNRDEIWLAMERAMRNFGRIGIAAMAVAAVDFALADAHARFLGQPLHRLLGAARSEVPVYGSGGFTSYHVSQLVAQCRGWVDEGIPAVKMKVGKDRGRSWREDVERVVAVRKAIGDDAGLFVDANGAYDRKQALKLGRIFADEADVSWFEEPVTSDDRFGLSWLREQLPLDVTAGEYGYELGYFRDMLQDGCVDVLQADIGRCAGNTEWQRVAALAAAWRTPVSAHCQPSMSLHPAAAVPNLRHIEYFHDHVRAEKILFDGIAEPQDGVMHLRDDVIGNGLQLKENDARPYRTG